ncbi:DUF3718 domain-containing protein [Neiella marina]|uniref:DUF3718 domain-containing protein n=1 Tax=Neiella holothuriorum TaxID=2870530 RepID=A0ABS7EJ76_9GAMM|nr:DUF3718 domain-containing protein [Neiella holothuriorum]MBW8192391.1 DUF3718 domain-containing protein [Neiella holothuriorum]
MKTLIISAVVTFGVLNMGVTNAAMNPVVEKALQNICYSSATDRLHNFKRTVKQYNLSMDKVANNVVCNGEDIGSFAAEHGAAHNANYIRDHQQGHVEVRELAVTASGEVPKA